MATPARPRVYLVMVLLLTFDLQTFVHSQVVDCGSLTDPAGGQVDLTSGTTFGQTATYSCNTGYNLVGDSTRTCQASGEWSGSAPTCEVVDCGSLTDPANGQVDLTSGTTFGSTITYSCNTGYNLVGDSTRTCQATGEWSGSAPTCEAVDCGSLTDPANGQVDLTSGTTFGQTATYSCNTGYNLVGDSTRTCQATGEWSGSVPTCVVVDCGSLTNLANGQVDLTSGTTFGQTATYSCNTGYNLVGDSTRTCQATGLWSGSVPTCVGAGDVWLSLRGTTYQNNSCVTLEDIGENDTALLCMTNLTACCVSPDIGSWFFPNGTKVFSFGDFYRTRGEMVVHLNRRRGGVEGIYRCEIPDSMNVIQTVYIGVYTTSSASIPTTFQTAGVSSPSSGTITTSESTKTVGTTTTIGTVPVSSSTLPTPPPSDGATTTSVIIVVAVVIILVVIVVGVVILVVIFRAKKRKQQLVINKIQNVMTENQDIEMKLKQEGTTEIEDKSSADQPHYAVIQKKAPPNVPRKSEELVEYLNKNTSLTGGYRESEIEPEQADSEYAPLAEPTRLVNLSESVSEKMESNPMYQSMDQQWAPSVLQENDIYTVPDITSSHTVDTDSGAYETVYSEPIQPSLFTDTVQTPSDSEDLQPYAPIYTVPTDMPKGEHGPLKVFVSNIREIHELGRGIFGKVVLAETVGLSAKDLRLSESDDDKSKSTLVAVKKLKSGAQNATKEAFQKEVNFMSRLTDRNVICILGVCYEDTPFIMMEYMEKGDLNQYLQKFKTVSTTDSEPQGQITTRTLVHMATQIASAMKYLASHNFVHRDLATRNCLVGPNYLVKISDFGMSRSLYDSHYYRVHGRAVLPVRWMSIECFYGKFSQKSDVWAFGVTVWEIFTLAKEQPYHEMSDKQVIDDALKGKKRKTLARPDMCPLKVYEIMLKCWAHNSKQQATFEELFCLLKSI